ncbi:MAG TPA: TetR/AcrR family transcriptional regulator [Thermoanaerobaculia bacterium]|nr:TetR/AcrR family transcriptional regulator [Thermoanaerobaculia bacterium]
MRYPAEHKEETRSRILRAAARQFRRAGSGAGIAGLMQDLALTHGGFYRHFKSKDQLFAAALEEAFDDVSSRLMGAAANARGDEIGAVIETYLGETHCANPADGCPIAALAGDVARQPRRIRMAMDRAFEKYAARFAPFCAGRTGEQQHRNAILLFAGMAGTLTLARATADESARNSILQSAREFYKRSFSPSS